ncbi:opacity protein-like surface antigen [Aliidiomarina maris]|nr:opacity protein-like surface antigen [Aliidiomarina maris]
MKTKPMVLSTLAALTLGLGSQAALAQVSPSETPSFSYVEAKYVERDEADTTFDGFEAELSARLGQYMFVSGSYSEVSGSVTGLGSTDLDIATGRVGFIFGQDQRVSAYVGPQVAYIKTNYGLGSDGEWQIGDESTTDWGAFAGVRAMVLPRMELNGEVSYIDFDRESLTSYSAGTRIYLTRNLAATGQLRMGDLDGFTVGVTYAF